jgi:hypothetical protein
MNDAWERIDAEWQGRQLSLRMRNQSYRQNTCKQISAWAFEKVDV